MKKAKKLLLVMGLILLIAAVSIGIFAYRWRNPTAPTPEAGKTYIACIGDSITFGSGVRSTRDTESYPAYLQQQVGDTFQVLNYGLSGRTLSKSGDSPYCDTKFYGLSLDAQADIYIIMLGTNDSKPANWDAEAYRADWSVYIEAYQAANPDAQIYLVQPCRAFPGEDGKIVYEIDDGPIATEIYDIVASVGEAYGLPVIDLYTFTKDHPEWYVDGVHPGAAGNRAIAEYIYSCLTK